MAPRPSPETDSQYARAGKSGGRAGPAKNDGAKPLLEVAVPSGPSTAPAVGEDLLQSSRVSETGQDALSTHSFGSSSSYHRPDDHGKRSRLPSTDGDVFDGGSPSPFSPASKRPRLESNDSCIMVEDDNNSPPTAPLGVPLPEDRGGGEPQQLRVLGWGDGNPLINAHSSVRKSVSERVIDTWLRLADPAKVRWWRAFERHVRWSLSREGLTQLSAWGLTCLKFPEWHQVPVADGTIPDLSGVRLMRMTEMTTLCNLYADELSQRQGAKKDKTRSQASAGTQDGGPGMLILIGSDNEWGSVCDTIGPIKARLTHQEKVRFSCPFCPHMLSSDEPLSGHALRVHYGLYPACRGCLQCYNNIRGLRGHWRKGACPVGAFHGPNRLSTGPDGQPLRVVTPTARKTIGLCPDANYRPDWDMVEDQYMPAGSCANTSTRL